MHDPMTVAFEIRWPGTKKLFITIWHVDPETDGTDDSCDWFGHRKTKETGWYPVYLDEYEKMSQAAREAVDFIWWAWNDKLGRPWWKHPRFHFWHWRFQVHPLQDLKRWLFSRCASCGKRFSWGYAPVSDSWDSEGPSWFHSEQGVYHHKCCPTYTPQEGHSGELTLEALEDASSALDATH